MTAITTSSGPRLALRDDGKFTITNVRPGTYTLHAFADGVLGEFAKTDITVEAGKNLDLGKLDWQPVRYGKQIWEIGYPNRNGGEFFKGDEYWRWGWCMRYALLFPNDITYTVGKSDWHKDWFFEEVPHATNLGFVNPAAKDPANQPFGWVANPTTAGQDMWGTWGRGKATTWTIKFNMDKAVQGQATLRVSLGGADGGGLAIGVNGKAVGSIRPVSTNALRYNTDRGVWHEYSQPFDARAAEGRRKRHDADRARRGPHFRRLLRLSAAGTPREIRNRRHVLSRQSKL